MTGPTRRSRAARRAEREQRERLPVVEAWLAAQRDDLRAVVVGLVDQADRFGLKEREWVDELEIDGHDDHLSPATMVILGLAAAEVRTAPAVLALDSTRPYAVHSVLARAEGLRSQFAELGAETRRCAASA